jgi:catechol 2,3-dioxygenase-like lactoylglutathione lyase family enzyme
MRPQPWVRRAKHGMFAATKGATMRITAIDHLQLGMPPGQEDTARAFYAGALGLTELGLTERATPAELAGSGGGWFAGGTAQIHLGVEADCRPARRAHPALVVEGLGALRARLEAAGHPTRDDIALPGIHRFNVDDPFGNRIELLEPIAG